MLRRDISAADNQLTARVDEEALLFRDMQIDMVNQLLRRLATIRLGGPVKKVATAAALDQALAQALPAAIWIATDEPLLQVEFGDRVRLRARALGHVERVVIDIGTGFDGSRLVGESRARSLFGDRRLLDLR